MKIVAQPFKIPGYIRVQFPTVNNQFDMRNIPYYGISTDFDDLMKIITEHFPGEKVLGITVTPPQIVSKPLISVDKSGEVIITATKIYHCYHLGNPAIPVQHTARGAKVREKFTDFPQDCIEFTR